ncbi:MAG: transposase [Gammaproteobacteria bacterium]|nr:transposase [Gammaproteobacteria bacterium]
MPRYCAERKAAVLKKLLPPHNYSAASVATEEGISDATLYSWLKQCLVLLCHKHRDRLPNAIMIA